MKLIQSILLVVALVCGGMSASAHETEAPKVIQFFNAFESIPYRRDMGLFYRIAAEQGHPGAQYHLGRMYDNGVYVPADINEAKKWFRLAAEQGHTEARYHWEDAHSKAWVSAFINAWSPSSDFLDSAEVVISMAEHGYARWQHNAGEMYLNGERGVSRDTKKAADWFNRAAMQGHADAQYHLGELYYSGEEDYKFEGVARNYAEAARWFRRAAMQGHADAQYHLGKLYARGDGVPKSIFEAMVWVYMAAGNGDKTAKEKVEELGLEKNSDTFFYGILIPAQREAVRRHSEIQQAREGKEQQ